MADVDEPEVETPPETPKLKGAELIKEVNRLIREAKKRWDAHENASCRRVRGQALRLYETLTPEEREQVPQVLRVWLRYRSVKYFGPQKAAKKRKRKPPGNG